MSEPLKPDFADMMEAARAQRSEHADKEIHWFSMFMAAQRRIKELEAELEKKPNLEVVK